MCGIAGFVGLDRSQDGMRDDLKAMCDAIVHRGPDDAGYHLSEKAALGMRRLSIIDLAGGHQPVYSEDGSIAIVFNGEIYNYRELRQRLERAGHQFRTHSDTETIVHLYEDVGDDVVDHLQGMFGFAIWDDRRKRLLVARDRLGIKPMYLWEHPRGLAFASELKSLRVLRGFPEKIDALAMAQYLALGYVPEPLSIFEGVSKLDPGHVLTWSEEEGIRTRRYWDPVRAEDPSIDERSAIEEIQRLVGEAVGARLVADVPLGAFLSGGIDSSSVVAEMSRQMDRPVQTFSIGFEEGAFNEAPDARIVAEALGTEHTELVVRPDVDQLIERVALAFDEPFADSSAIPTFLVSELARRHVTVSLSGDGGDELFGGYTRYADALRRDLPLPGLVRRVLGGVGRALPHGALGRNRILSFARSREGRYADTVAFPLSPAEGGVGGAEVVRRIPSQDDLLQRWFSGTEHRDHPSRLMLVDLRSYLPGDILTKVDRMSMAVSLEARVPLLDHRLVEFAVSLPSALKVRGQGKWIFRKAMGERLPRHVFDKPKQGFGVPLRSWFRGELRHRVDALRTSTSGIYEWVDQRAVSRVIDEHLRGRRDHSHQIWRLLVLHLWLSQGALSPAAAGSRPVLEKA